MRAQRSRASTARKPPVNLTLSEGLVEELKGVTGNLSGVVESLLADVLSGERERRSGTVEHPQPRCGLFSRQRWRHAGCRASFRICVVEVAMLVPSALAV